MDDAMAERLGWKSRKRTPEQTLYISTTKETCRKATTAELKSVRAKKLDVVKRMVGSLYPHIIGGEIALIDQELERRLPRKVVVVTFNADESTFNWHVNGRRVYPVGHRRRHEMPLADQLKVWFKKAKITHVDSRFNETKTTNEQLKDGVYTVKAYLQWWRRVEIDD